MGVVVPLGVRQQPNAELIRLLENMVRQAKAGELVHLAAGGIHADDGTFIYLSAGMTKREAIGLLDTVKHEILDTL